MQRLSNCRKFECFNLELQEDDSTDCKRIFTAQEHDFLHELCYQSDLVLSSQRKKHLLRHNSKHSILQKQSINNHNHEEISKTAGD